MIVTMKINGVKFDDEKQYNAVKRIVNTFQIEDMNPTFERIQGIKDLIDGKITPNDLRNNNHEVQKHNI